MHMNTELRLNRPQDLVVSTGSLDAYIHAAYQLPILSAEEENALAVRLHDHGDLEAARLLITHHLRFVVKIARGYNGYGLQLADLIQEGNIGLMKAVKRFNPDANVRLVSFAVHWIRAEMHEFILRNWRIVKVATTKAQRKLFFNLRSKKKRLGWLNHAEVEAVAKDLGVTSKDVLEMESRLSGHDMGFDYGDNDEDSSSPAHYLEHDGLDPSATLEATDFSSYQLEKLNAAMAALDERSKTIIQSRWLTETKSTLHELAAEFSISAERVRQLENNAIKKLQHCFAG